MQRLDRLIPLDVNCHHVQHLGLAGVKGGRHLVRRRLTEVNGWEATVSVEDFPELIIPA